MANKKAKKAKGPLETDIAKVPGDLPRLKRSMSDLECKQVFALLAYFRVMNCTPDELPHSAKAACERLKTELADLRIARECLNCFDEFFDDMQSLLGPRSNAKLHPLVCGLLSQYTCCCCEGGSPPLVYGAEGRDSDDDVWPADDGKWGA